MKTKKLFLSLAIASCLLYSQCSTKKEKAEEVKIDVPVTAETALQSYLNNDDKSYKWEVLESYPIEGMPITAYDLKLTSQKWREHVWKHQLTILVPEVIEHDGGLLFITGGSVKDGEPNLSKQTDETAAAFGVIAAKNKAICAIIRQTPNQPLYDGLVEDQLISFTLHNFKNDGDYTWPLLFPMVKTAVRSMDAIQEFAEQKLETKINRFVVSGASKRGWTTWLTGANDARVEAIAPMVIDVLNMPVSLNYQIEVWKEYSIQIEDYVKLEIPQQVHTEAGDAITKMVDPYSYREKLTMPKMIIIGTIDEYWPVDAIKNYIDSIPGQNFIQYVPNAGHGLGDKTQALQSVSSFFSNTLLKKPYPVCGWKINEENSKINLTAIASPDQLKGALIWSADSEDRDFRDEEWTSQDLSVSNIENVETSVDYPKSGFKAFYIDLKYTDPNGEGYVESTRMFVADSVKVYVH
ncbi:PhoPQ-activated protein PqaA family protein [Reichenbachiella sp. MALMAid0571]|uniref:PhoPQ-activated pathogenicity-related family protein n=1 Tax=Reichenbachiella sp. MALMAid0571 TaxID=3143939 RepID=UPI0032DF8E57